MNINKNQIYQEIYVFGAGGAASWIVGSIVRAGLSVIAILDENCEKKYMLSGVPVINPHNIPDNAKELPVVIGVMNPIVDEYGIKQRLNISGFKNILSYGEFLIKYDKKLEKSPFMLDVDEYRKNQKKFLETRILYKDKRSIEIHESINSYMMDFCFPINQIDIDKVPYFNEDLPRYAQNLRMIDCGAYTGDTIASAISCGYKLESCIAFEPDLKNYLKLSRYVLDKNLEVIPLLLGLSDIEKLVGFSSQGGSGSSINGTADSFIQCVTLDKTANTFFPNLIKMDIEGAEYSALCGGLDLLKKYKPCLALSIYHQTEDFWKIPKLIYAIYGDNAEYYLRKHSNYLADIVFYVFPK